LIAQDSTRYGTDIYGKPQLFELLEEIEQLKGKFRYRVLYLYPDLLTLSQLKKLTSFQKFIPYFDIPLQHISSPVLQSMGRFYDEQAIYTFLEFIKEEFPVHFIRTNFIIGFPGETEEDVEKLCEFIAKEYFDNIALFEYHDETLAESSKLPDKISDKVLHERFRKIRSLVNQLFLAHEKRRKGKENWGYVQEIHQSHSGKVILSVRPWLHCPEIDEVDDISLEQVVICEDEEVYLGSKITYVV
jgi:ribosomal protein S12 methylthiotransferase